MGGARYNRGARAEAVIKVGGEGIITWWSDVERETVPLNGNFGQSRDRVASAESIDSRGSR